MDTENIKRNVELLADMGHKIEQAYERKAGISRDADAIMIKLSEEVGELAQAYLQHTARRQSDGSSKEEIFSNVEDQVTDVIMFVLILGKKLDMDFESALERKWFRFIDKVDGLD